MATRLPTKPTRRAYAGDAPSRRRAVVRGPRSHRPMAGSPPAGSSPSDLVAALAVATGGHAARAPLRQRLQHAGSRAVPALLKALSSGDDFARWEAVNLLGILAPSCLC